MTRKIKYYRLAPVYEPFPGERTFASAAIVTDAMTGEHLDGMGGGGLHLSPQSVSMLPHLWGNLKAIERTMQESLVGDVTSIHTPAGKITGKKAQAVIDFMKSILAAAQRGLQSDPLDSQEAKAA